MPWPGQAERDRRLRALGRTPVPPRDTPEREAWVTKDRDDELAERRQYAAYSHDYDCYNGGMMLADFECSAHLAIDCAICLAPPRPLADLYADLRSDLRSLAEGAERLCISLSLGSERVEQSRPQIRRKGDVDNG